MGEFKPGVVFNPGKVAIYDCPDVVAKSISQKLSSFHFDVLFSGKLDKGTARADADVWITKWTACLSDTFLGEHHPKKGIITLSVGKEHIDLKSAQSLGLDVMSCPNFSSNSVAEHAMALALRSLYDRSSLPPIKAGQLIFANFSDDFAEQAVSQILLRSRQMDLSMGRARKYDYARYDEPWANEELRGMRILIIGKDRPAIKLAQMLNYGFDCQLYGFEGSDSLEAYNLKPLGPIGFLEHSASMDYIFLCTDGRGRLDINRNIDALGLEAPDMGFSGSSVAVLGTGRIGSRIARMARLGFNCKVTAFSTTEKPELTGLGIRYASTVHDAISEAQFIFIALPFNESTKSLITSDEIGNLSADRSRVLINVTRDKILDSQSLFGCLSSGMLTKYSTDVLPNDAILWQGGQPDDMTKKFVQHMSVVATPHEGDCSRKSLARMLDEVLESLWQMLR